MNKKNDTKNMIVAFAITGVGIAITISTLIYTYNRNTIINQPYIELREQVYKLADRDKDINLGLQTNERIELYNSMGFEDLSKYDSDGNIKFFLPCNFNPSWDDSNGNTCNIRCLEKALKYYQENP